MRDLRFCLVTGCPRSGTTALGALLADMFRTAYLYEPMNFLSGDTVIPSYFCIPGSTEFPEDTASDFLQRMQNLDLRLKPGLWGNERGLRRASKLVIGGRSRVSLRFAKFNPFLEHVVWKDPFAFFSIPFIQKTAPMPVIIMRRPIEGVCASFKRMGWRFDCHDLLARLNDPELPLSLCEGVDLSDPVQNGAFLWNIIEFYTKKYIENDSVISIGLPDLITKPVETAELAFRHCRITLKDVKLREISKTYSRVGGVPLDDRVHRWGLDLKDIQDYWKRILTAPDQSQMMRISRNFLLD